MIIAQACLLVALAVPAQASRPASQPSPTGGKASEIYGEFTVIFELGDGSMNTQESWRLRNDSARTVAPSETRVPVPAGARKLHADEEGGPFVAEPDSSAFKAKRALGPGEHSVSGAYVLPVDGGTVRFSRRVPFNMGGARLILEESSGLALSSNVKATKRSRDLNGVKFAIWDLEAFAPGTQLDIEISGLPSRSTLPRSIALGAIALILLWMIWALKTGTAPGAQATAPLGVLSAKARTDRIMRAVELLEAALAAEKITSEQHERRKKTLLKQLASTLRERSLEQPEAR